MTLQLEFVVLRLPALFLLVMISLVQMPWLVPRMVRGLVQTQPRAPLRAMALLTSLSPTMHLLLALQVHLRLLANSLQPPSLLMVRTAFVSELASGSQRLRHRCQVRP